MLLGFRTLENALQHKQTEACKLIIMWLSLFLEIQSKISTQGESIRDQFEKLVPSAVTYMIGCLQHKAKSIISYHFQLLEMIQELLGNVRPQVLEKLATFETGIIACIWFPIDFVGDFNTQLMAVRLIVMLLKRVDSTRLQSELANIRCADKPVMKDKLSKAIAVTNVHTATFENTARDLLNTYNMHLAKNILVYSFRCKTFKFGDRIEFFKPMNADHFWIDFNYCPRTLSFSGLSQTNNQATCTYCSVSLQIEKLSLDNLTLIVHFQTPVQLINAVADFPDIANVTTAEIILPRDEAMRLIENKFVLEFYNKPHRPKNASFVKFHNTSTRIRFQSIERANSTVFDNLLSESDNNSINILVNENKENIPSDHRNTPGTNSELSINQYSKSRQSNLESVSKKFQKSIDFLISLSKKDNEDVNPNCQIKDTTSVEKSTKPIGKLNFKLPHLSNLEKQLNKTVLENNQQKTITAKIVDYCTSASESRPSSQKSMTPSKESFKKPQKRFFKTQTSTSESDCIPSKPTRIARKQNVRNKSQRSTDVSVKRVKKVNEVKPMVHSNKEFNQSEPNISNNISRNAINTVINTKVLTSNPPNLSDPSLSNLPFDEYENRVVSDAEPGRSYRNFKIRRNPTNQQFATVGTKRSRKTLPRAVKKDILHEFLLPGKSQASRKPKPMKKRPIFMDPFDEVKGQEAVPHKIGKPNEMVSHEKNICINSAEMENIANTVLPNCTSLKRKESVKNSLNRTSAIKAKSQTLNCSLNPKATSETSTKLFQDNNSNELEKTSIRSTLSVSADVAKISEGRIAELQECRQNTGHEETTAVGDYEEFSDFPMFPSLMDISNILPSSDCESTKNRTIQTNRLNKNDPELVTKKNCCDLPNQTVESNMLMPHSSFIYCSRSENNSDSEKSTISHNDIVNPISQPLELPQHMFVTPQVPLKNFQTTTRVTKCHVTTTATSIITQQDRAIRHEEFVVNLSALPNTPLNLSKRCSRATATTTIKTIVKERKEINLNSSFRKPANITAITPIALKQESSNLLTTYKDKLNFELEQMETSISQNYPNVYIKKICDVGESILNEIERERQTLLELEANAERLARQLGWQYEAYQQKTQQFECFKQNVEDLLRVLSNVKLMEEVQIDTENKIQQLQQTSNSITKHIWRNFINETTENLLKNISSLSDL